jgi:protein O-GlcNAc transferase
MSSGIAHTGSVQIPGGIDVCTPDDIRLMTVYVLREQGDWFEDEIKFLRTALWPEANVVDIGANYGCYALTAAALCSRGRVWAYEPCSGTAGYLRQSKERNGFINLCVVQAALSDRCGTGRLCVHDNSELNALGEATDGEDSEDIVLTTVDDQRRACSWPAIDFMKIDAEGHEPQVIAGGRRFFTEDSPLVMLELRKSTEFDFGASQLLGELGYELYRYIPGIGALVPQQADEAIDPYQLNAFCCKPDRAAELAARGLLLRRSDAPASIPPRAGAWATHLAAFPYGRAGIPWQSTDGQRRTPQQDAYEHALDLYVAAMTPGPELARRWAWLRGSFDLLAGLCERAPNMPRLMSFARVAAEVGQRQRAVDAVMELLQDIYRIPRVDVSEPFLSPSREFEDIDPGSEIAGWMVCSILDAYEKLRAFSSYFLPEPTRLVATQMRSLGFCTPEIARRDALTALRASARATESGSG